MVNYEVNVNNNVDKVKEYSYPEAEPEINGNPYLANPDKSITIPAVADPGHRYSHLSGNTYQEAPPPPGEQPVRSAK